MANKQLSDKQLEAFARDGFIILPKLYSQNEIDAASRAIDDLVQREHKVGEEMVYFEDSLVDKGQRILSRVENFVNYSEPLSSLVFGERMCGIAAELLGEESLLFKEKINFKMPGGGGFEPHQDIQPGWDDYCSYFISVLVTIDESTIQNGCLELSVGAHKNGLIGEKWKPLTGDQLKGIEFVPYPMSPGDVAFFDCFVPHQSKPNLTASQRRNLYLTYNRQSEGDHRQKYFADKRNSFPPDNERDPAKVYMFRV